MELRSPSPLPASPSDTGPPSPTWEPPTQQDESFQASSTTTTIEPLSLPPPAVFDSWEELLKSASQHARLAGYSLKQGSGSEKSKSRGYRWRKFLVCNYQTYHDKDRSRSMGRIQCPVRIKATEKADGQWTLTHINGVQAKGGQCTHNHSYVNLPKAKSPTVSTLSISTNAPHGTSTSQTNQSTPYDQSPYGNQFRSPQNLPGHNGLPLTPVIPQSHFPSHMTKTMEGLFALPRVRNPEYWVDRKPPDITQACNYEALLGYERGTIAPVPCTHCAAKRPASSFQNCVTVNNFFGGSCCSCVLYGGCTECSFFKEPPGVLVIKSEGNQNGNVSEPRSPSPTWEDELKRGISMSEEDLETEIRRASRTATALVEAQKRRKAASSHML